MIRNAKDLSKDQKSAIESLLGRPVSENEQISVRAITSEATPEWLEKSWQSASDLHLDQLTTEDIDVEVAAARQNRHRSDS